MAYVPARLADAGHPARRRPARQARSRRGGARPRSTRAARSADDGVRAARAISARRDPHRERRRARAASGRTRAATLIAEWCERAATGWSSAQLVPDDAHRITPLLLALGRRRRRGPDPHDRRHRLQPARRHPGSDAARARARGARARRAAAPARARPARPTRCSRAGWRAAAGAPCIVNLPGSPGGVARRPRGARAAGRPRGAAAARGERPPTRRAARGRSGTHEHASLRLHPPTCRWPGRLREALPRAAGYRVELVTPSRGSRTQATRSGRCSCSPGTPGGTGGAGSRARRAGAGRCRVVIVSPGAGAARRPSRAERSPEVFGPGAHAPDEVALRRPPDRRAAPAPARDRHRRRDRGDARGARARRADRARRLAPC